MKKICFLISFVFICGLAKAQQEQPNDPQQTIEALKVAFISKEINLTPEEAQKFWPVYNQYSKEIVEAIKNNPDEALKKEEAVLNIRKKYNDQFIKIIGAQRTNHLFIAEKSFHQVLIKALRRQQRIQQTKPNRQFLRRN